jgi:MSHA biogenesis protein MshJ
MKKQWQMLSARIDAMSMRERVMVFGAVAAVLVFVLHALVLSPMLARQAQLKKQVEQERKMIAAIDAEVMAAVEGHAKDPDEATRAHLKALEGEASALNERLRNMQNELVTPDRMAPLLETILRANGRLKLVGMKTLPVTVMNGAPPPATGTAPTQGQGTPAPAEAAGQGAGIASGLLGALAGANGTPQPSTPPAPAAAPVSATGAPLLYRHGVEITVRGNYLDMVSYLEALQGLPVRLFWGKADLQVETYPDARLTLTLYTMSLDQKWMTL